MLDEFAKVIERPHFARKFAETGISRRRMVNDYAEISTIISPTKLSDQISRDPDDDAVLACALAADCEFIVTGDNDLLRSIEELKSQQPPNFFERWRFDLNR